LSIERRRRPARERDRFGGPYHAPSDGYRRVVPERALAAPQPRFGDEGAEGTAPRHQDEGEPSEAGPDQGREEGERVREPDSQLRAPPLSACEGSPDQRAGRRRESRAR